MKKSAYIKSKFFRKYAKFFIGIIIGIVVTIASVYYAATTYFDSLDVAYDNTVSDLASNDVQNSIDELYTLTTNSFLDKVYPVGSIYVSATLDTTTKVTNALGGTWEAFGSGKVLISANSTYQINTTGGSASESFVPQGSNSDLAITMNKATLTHSGMAVSMNTATLGHTGGKLGDTTLTEAQLPKVTGSITMHNAADSTPIHAVGGHFSAGVTNSNKYTGVALLHTSGSTSIGIINLSFGGGKSHTHTYTQPNAHTFTPTVKSYTNPAAHIFIPSVKSYTNPTFTGTKATISHIQPYITVYMYKRKS